MLDATGSMSGLIDGAKRKIWSIANQLASGEPRPDVRMALVAYRDRGDVFVTRTLELTGDIDAVYADLKRRGVRFTYGPRPVNRGNRLELWAAAFRDPDGHFLEVLSFPPGKGDPKWHRPGDTLVLRLGPTALVAGDSCHRTVAVVLHFIKPAIARRDLVAEGGELRKSEVWKFGRGRFRVPAV